MKKKLLCFVLLSIVLTATIHAQVATRRLSPNTGPGKKNNSTIVQRQGPAGTQSVSGIIREGFEGTTFPPAGWQTVNVLGPEVFLRSTMLKHSGLASAFCLYEQTTPTGEDWLIMPKFNAVATDSMHFWLGIVDPGYPDSLYVLVSTTDSALASFTTKLLILSDGNGYPTVHHGFVQKSLSLAAFAGQSIYVAFRNWNSNGDGISIDDVDLGTPPAADAASISWDKPHVLGDTTQSVIATVKNAGTSTQTFNVTMTLTGGYTSTKTVTALAPNATKQVAFNSWTPSVMGTNMVKMYTQLAGDGYRMNDTLIDTLHISHISNDDIKAVSINVPLKTGNTAQTPMATVRNNGFNTESFNVTMTITGGYTSTIPVTNLAPFATQQISFASWTPSVLGNNTVKFYSQLATDANKTNDTLQTVIQVFPAFVNYGWSSKPVMPDKFFGNASAFYHTGTYPNDTSIVFSLCGIDSTGAMGTINTAYSSLTNNWGPKSSAPYARYQGSAQTVNGKVYLMGGFVPGLAPSNRNDIYTIASNSWSIGSSMPQSIADFATAVYKDSLIYVIGGWDSTATPTNNVQIYNTYTNAWTSGTAKTGTATYGVRCGIYKNKIVAVGGSDGTSPKNEAVLGVINAAAPGTIAWSALPNYPGFPVLRHTGGSVYKDELPLIIFTSGDTAGYSNAGVTYFTNETWGYDLVANMWKIGPPKITGTNDNMNLLGAVFNDSLYMISVGGHGSTKPLRVNEWLNMGPDTSSHILGVAQKQVAALQVNVYPNPFNDKTTVTFDLAKEQKIVAGVYDVHGRLVAELANKIFSTGTYSLVWNSSSCASGIYMLRIVVGNAALNKKLIKN